MKEKIRQLEEQIRKEKSTEKKIILRDQLYHEKEKILMSKKRKRKQKCMWPDCDNKATSMGMCATCRTKHYNSKLLCADSRAFIHEEMIDLYKDIIQFMKDVNITKEEAVTWLIAEGLNSYDKRKEEIKKRETTHD